MWDGVVFEVLYFLCLFVESECVFSNVCSCVLCIVNGCYVVLLMGDIEVVQESVLIVVEMFE